MKISAVVLARNFEYGTVSLKNRAVFCLNSLIDTFDEVSYIDWGSANNSLLYDIKNDLEFRGNLKHFVIPENVAAYLTNYNPDTQKPCEVLARNIGLSRSTGDWLVSTNIDIICPRRDELLSLFSTLDNNTMYTISRRGVEFDYIQKYHNSLNSKNSVYKDWKLIREYLIATIGERVYSEAVVSEDKYSLINCCGDFQCAPKHLWKTIKGFEEKFIYALYTDTNLHKKSVEHGFNIKALFSPALYHINHGPGGGGFCTGLNRRANDPYQAIIHQQKTENPDTWGFSDIEIEYEIL